MFSIIGCLHNDLNLDVADMLVESIEKMKYYWYDRVGF